MVPDSFNGLSTETPADSEARSDTNADKTKQPLRSFTDEFGNKYQGEIKGDAMHG